MKAKNIFYLFKESSVHIISNYSYDMNTGEMSTGNGSAVPKRSIINKNVEKIRIYYTDIPWSYINCLYWDKNDNYLGHRLPIYTSEYETSEYVEFDIPENTEYVAIFFAYASINRISKFREGIKINPHYKQLKKKFKKENNQVFFRESLDGKISLFGIDYLVVKNASLDEILYFYIYRNNQVYVSASFNKSDCKFDYFKKSVELKLTYNDKYSKILNAYDNTYDLITLAPALTRLILTKRTILQIYTRGDSVISNYAGGTYWETEVNESIYNEEELENKYHFARGPEYSELILSGFNYNINGSYNCPSNSNIWNSTSGSIVFTLVAHAEDAYTEDFEVKLLSSGQGEGTRRIGGAFGGYVEYIYDTYKIEIYGGRDGTGPKLYESVYAYGKDTTGFTLSAGNELYPMKRVWQETEPSPYSFNLGNSFIKYQIWGRILCDAYTFTDDGGQVWDTFDLPNDDFATPRRNYRKCFGVYGFDGPNSVARIIKVDRTSNTPTSYGMNDYGKYFMPPITYSGQYFYPLARSAWANTSLWMEFGDPVGNIDAFERYCRKFYREYSIKDTYHIGDVIKALLKKIDPSIKHEKTSAYSSFLYGHSGATASALGNCNLYITQKTNILKGEYDQAAQKAEIKFKQLMEMLRDCFRCYWFIDEQNRFRIEHISYFMNGLSYNSPTVQIDLTEKNDKFNKKVVTYCQQEVEFDKTDLTSRYEFKYADDVTKAMGGDLYVNVDNEYIQKDKTEEINIDNFTADVDYMLFLPDDFSNDGFALLLADSNNRVPIIKKEIIDEKQYNNIMQVYVQNWYASFNQLIWHYMEDISGYFLTCNNIDQESLYAHHVKKCMKQNIEFPSSRFNIDVYKLITTDVGNGYIEEMTTNIDTDMTEIELRYEPR